MSETVPDGQAPGAVVMVRPVGFRPNPSTAVDNAFQAVDVRRGVHEMAYAAYREVTRMAEVLRDNGVQVHLFDDAGHDLPDSVFPNNWFSTHPDGRIALYPMYSPNRRGERRPDVIEALRRRYDVASVTDYSGLEDEDVFLEGTGAMVLDHLERVAYIARSHRAHDRAVSRVCADLGYEPVVFSTHDRRGLAIYHTNVMMSVGTTLAILGADTITDPVERHAIEDRLRSSGRTVVSLTHDQVDDFAGNAIELAGGAGPLLLMSERARASLRPDQVETIEAHVAILAVPVPTIELAGGSVRCMVAGIHLPVPEAAEASHPQGLELAS